ncbi:MAG: hypothetical protein M5F18_05570 [Asgard group archaeon]|nr:hypothetical protein [Asgard group archaeon]
MLGSTAKRVIVAGSRRQFVRLNSSNNGNNSELNIGELFKKIDQVTLKAAELKRKQESDKLKQQAQQAHNRLKKVSHQNAASVRRLPKRASGENEAVEKQTTSNEESQPKSEKTFRNRFQKDQEASNREAVNNRPRRSFETSDRVAPAFSQKKSSKEEPRFAPRINNRSSGTNGPSFRKSSPRKVARGPGAKLEIRKPTVAKPIHSKEVSATPLSPKIVAEDFFYGKVPSINSTVSGRLASIAKLTLDDSKYPYLLPKEVIAQAARESKNKYILQKNWKINPDQDVLKERIQTIALGQKKDLEIAGEKSELADKTLHNINLNPDLSLEQKDAMFKIVNGLQDIKSIFKDAPWKKQASK